MTRERWVFDTLYPIVSPLRDVLTCEVNFYTFPPFSKREAHDGDGEREGNAPKQAERRRLASLP